MSQARRRLAQLSHRPGRVHAGRWTGLTGSALHAEWTKLRTVAGPAWLLIATVAATVAISAAATCRRPVPVRHRLPGRHRPSSA